MDPCIQGWDLLKYRNIVRHASSKRMKKFINSLDTRLLKRIMAIYIDSIVSPLLKDYKHLTATGTLKEWKDSKKKQTKETLYTKDTQILKLLRRYCKYKKPPIYQNQSRLLSCIPMEILAYSFSFLSFRELSAIQPVCLYFMKASRKYSQISHHHLDVNYNFMKKLAFNQLNLSLLTHFQSIHISYAYISRKMEVFKYIMKSIISHSYSSLKSLTIELHHADNRMKCVVLDFILKAAPFFPALRSIYWRADCCSRIIDYNALRATIYQKVSQLYDLEIHNWTGGIEGGIQSILNYHIPNPFYLTLKSLHLKDNQFLSTDIVPNILQHMKHLTDLHIDIFGRSVLSPEIRRESLSKDVLNGNANLILRKHKMGFINTSVQKLHLKFGLPSPDTPTLLIYFFVHCVNISDLTLDLSNINTDWCLLFDLLMEQKAKYGDAKHFLSKITICANQTVAMLVLGALHKTISIQPQLKRLKHIEFKLERFELSGFYRHETYPKLDIWTNVTRNTIAIFDQLETVNIQMPPGHQMFDIHWNRNDYALSSCNVPKPMHLPHDFYANVTELNLCASGIFELNLIPVVLQTVSVLAKLSISTNIPDKDVLASDFIKLFDMMNNKQQSPFYHHPTLNTLSLRLAFNGNYTMGSYHVPMYSIDILNHNAQYILYYFYCMCPHVTELSLRWEVALQNDERLTIPWRQLFDLWQKNKMEHSAQFLSKLSVKCSNEPFILCNILNELIMLENNIRYLNHVVLHQYDGKLDNELLKKFLQIVNEKDGPLLSLEIYTCHDNYKEYGEYIVMLLEHLPTSLVHLDLKFAFHYRYDAWWKPKCKNIYYNEYDDFSWKIVKCLVNLSANNNLNIKDIDFERLCLQYKAKEYLKFFFGYRNKLICDEDDGYKITIRSD